MLRPTGAMRRVDRKERDAAPLRLYKRHGKSIYFTVCRIELFGYLCRGLQTAPASRGRPSVSRVREEPTHLTGGRPRATPGKRRDVAVAVCNIPSKKRLDVLPETSRPFARNV